LTLLGFGSTLKVMAEMAVSAATVEGGEGMATLDTTKAKDTFGDTVNRAAYGKERIILTRRGKPVAAIVPLEDLELLDELENAADAAEVAEARAEAAQGEIVAWEAVKGEFGL
jgi:prevent-host-death family protein